MPTLDTLAHVSILLFVAFFVSLIPALWERIRGVGLPEGVHALQGVLPVMATVDELGQAWSAIGSMGHAMKLDPRFVGLNGTIYTLSGTVILGIAAIALSMAIGRASRRAAAAMIPGTLGLAGWLALYSRQLAAVAVVAPADKQALWGAGEPYRVGIVALTLGLCLVVAALAPRPVERALALLAALPLLFVPTWLVWWMVGSATAG